MRFVQCTTQDSVGLQGIWLAIGLLVQHGLCDVQQQTTNFVQFDLQILPNGPPLNPHQSPDSPIHCTLLNRTPPPPPPHLPSSTAYRLAEPISRRNTRPVDALPPCLARTARMRHRWDPVSTNPSCEAGGAILRPLGCHTTDLSRMVHAHNCNGLMAKTGDSKINEGLRQ